MKKNKVVLYFALVVFTTLLVLVSEIYYYFSFENNESIDVQQFSKIFFDAIVFSFVVNSIIHISNYYVEKKKKTHSNRDSNKN